MAYEEHIQSAQDLVARCVVLTLSDTRDKSTDKSGARIKELLGEQKHVIFDYGVIPDDPGRLECLLLDYVAIPDVDVILTNGGTGISRRDQTIRVIEKFIDQPLPG